MVQKEGSIQEKTDGKRLTVILRGEIDHHNAVRLRTSIDKLISEKRPLTLVVDVEDIHFMDSSGLGLLMGRYKKMQELGGKMILQNPNTSVLKICQLAGLGRLIQIETKA